MATLVGTQKNFMDAVKALLEMEYNSLEMYEAILNRIEGDEYRKVVEKFKHDHENHISTLIRFLEGNKVDFKKGPGGEQLLLIGKVAISKMLGDDKTILKSAIGAESDTITAYARLLEYEDYPEGAEELLQQGLRDEKSHKKWLVETTSNKD